MPPNDARRTEASGAAGQWLALDTPLGPDALVVTRMVGDEGVSRLFHVELLALSERQAIAPADLLGKVVTLAINADAEQGGAPARFINGIVTRFRAGRILQSGLREYRIEVSPKLWVMQRSSRYRVYQNKTVQDIILTMLRNADVAYTNNLTLTFETRDYCVQYGETDFAFIERLMAEEGIFYYFAHAAGEHKLVLEDSKTWSSGAGQEAFYSASDASLRDLVTTFEYGPAQIDRTYLATDYNFETPTTQIDGTTSTGKQPSASTAWQHHVHGVARPVKASAKQASTVQVASQEAGYETGGGTATDPRLAPGFVFELKNHADAALDGRKFVVTEVRHDAVEPDRYTQPAGEPRRAAFRCDFACVPAQVPLPRPVPPQKPLARGPMTALVVGPSGAEIHTDVYGRIRVQFPWDQDGKKDDTSSCFIRVAQPWSGKNWGALFVPRVGMEVVVQFLDGDPDRPLVTGTVYNGANKPPWTLPNNMTKSGFLTRSTQNGEAADANELSFEDKKGCEVILIHAQRDLVREVEHDETITVENDQLTKVKNNQVTEVTKDRTTTVKEGTDTLKVETGDQLHEVSKGNRVHTVKTGNDTLEVSTGNRAVTVKTGNHDLKLSTGNASTKCEVGQIKLEATGGITLKCGQNKIELTPTGITVNGITVAIKGTAMLEGKAPIVKVKGDGMTVIEGSIVKIN